MIIDFYYYFSSLHLSCCYIHVSLGIFPDSEESQGDKEEERVGTAEDE